MLDIGAVSLGGRHIVNGQILGMEPESIQGIANANDDLSHALERKRVKLDSQVQIVAEHIVLVHTIGIQVCGSPHRLSGALELAQPLVGFGGEYRRAGILSPGCRQACYEKE